MQYVGESDSLSQVKFKNSKIGHFKSLKKEHAGRKEIGNPWLSNKTWSFREWHTFLCEILKCYLIPKNKKILSTCQKAMLGSVFCKGLI